MVFSEKFKSLHEMYCILLITTNVNIFLTEDSKKVYWQLCSGNKR